MSLFLKFPKDILRLICIFLEDEELSKIGDNLFDDNDVFWTLKSQKISHVLPSKKNYYKLLKCLKEKGDEAYLDFGMYDVYILKYRDNLYPSGWNNHIVDRLLEDEASLKKFVNYIHQRGSWLLLQWIVVHRPDIEIIKKLIGYGSNLTNVLADYCISESRDLSTYPIIDILLQAGADINEQTPLMGRTPLMTAIFGNRNLSLFKRLLELGANIDLKDIAGSTALEYARVYGAIEICQILEEALKKKK
jgi:ankyrin repeat protein